MVTVKLPDDVCCSYKGGGLRNGDTVGSILLSSFVFGGRRIRILDSLGNDRYAPRAIPSLSGDSSPPWCDYFRISY